jgi:3-isopropylmalate/(R)-2-methylmalate dehydratase small subunit
MKNFDGKVLFLDRNDINTDEIIPARYLTELTKEALKPYCMEDLELQGFNATTDLDDKAVIITRENFGCGSSREHAPWALEQRGINMVIAENFARIFRQNMFNCGMMAVELPKDKIVEIFNRFQGKETQMVLDWDKAVFTLSSGSEKVEYTVKINGFDKNLVEAGGWVEYADSKY